MDLPALGFGMGDVVLLELLRARALLPKFSGALDAFCLIEDEALRSESLKLIQDLRSAGLAVDYSLTPGKSDRQFKRAQELQAAYTARLERNEAGELVARIKNLKTRQDNTASPTEAVRQLGAGRQ